MSAETDRVDALHATLEARPESDLEAFAALQAAVDRLRLLDQERLGGGVLELVRVAGAYALALGVDPGEIVLASIGTEPCSAPVPTADCECCVCCRDVPCLSTMRRGPCELLPCLHVGR